MYFQGELFMGMRKTRFEGKELMEVEGFLQCHYLLPMELIEE